MDLGIRGKVALVTAASRGLGLACARALAVDGVRLAMCSRNQIRIKKAAKQLSNEHDVDTRGYVCDVRKQNDLNRLLESVRRDLGGIDILVFNGGNPPAGHFDAMPQSAWAEGLALCLQPSITLAKAVIPHMVKQRWGRIIFLTSIFAREPDPGFVISSTLRAGQLSLMKCLAKDTAMHGVTVNAVLPGYTDTPLLRECAHKAGASSGTSESRVLSAWVRAVPRGRFAEPREIGDLVAWLSGTGAGNISGAAIQSDGATMQGI